MGFLAREDVDKLGLACAGRNVLISDKACLYNPKNIRLGNNVRIDDFCVLSAGEGGIEIGDYVHISVYSSIIGGGKVTLSDFSGLSSRVSIHSSNDDYSGASLTNPTVPPAYKAVVHNDVFLGRHVIVGSGSVILPGAVLETGVSVGALSLISKRCEAFGIYAGMPARRIAWRSQELLKVEQRLMLDLEENPSSDL